MDKFVTIKTYNNNEEAELAKNILADNDIESEVKADDCAGMVPFLLYGSNGVHLLVRKEDAEKAIELLETATFSEEDLYEDSENIDKSD